MNSRRINQISSGIYNLDYFICGGFPLGGLTLIEEDEFACLSNLILNCTISNQLHEFKKIIVSLPTKLDIDTFLKELPKRIKLSNSDNQQQDSESMKIAWRYSNLPDLDEMSNQNRNDFQFELRNKLDNRSINEYKMNENLNICTHDELINKLNEIDDESNDRLNKINGTQLIIIKNYATINNEFNENQFCTFLFKLKSLSRLLNIGFILSLNSNYLSKLIRQLSINIVDCSLKVERLTENSVYKNDYLGLIKIDKLPKINSLNYQTNTETLEIGIQFKKNRFLTIDRLFLPPELSDEPTRTPLCSTTKIDF